MEKQTLLFEPSRELEKKYTAKIEAPIYEPRHSKPDVMVLCDAAKTSSLLREIEASKVTEAEKRFLSAAAHRHTVFHYERIADYYAHATPEMQRLMERSALVIIDFEAAIEQGFVRLCDDIRTQYLEEYAGNDDAA